MSDSLSITVRLGDITEGGALRVMAGDQPIAVVRTEGQLFAIRDVCSHADVALSEGEVDGCFIECWLHGSRFDLRTGTPMTLPAITPVPIYPVHVEGSGDDATVRIDLSTPTA